jgi:hypothetical protein
VSIIPSPWPVCHIARRTSTNPADEDDHGTRPPVESPPTIRKAMSFLQHGRTGSSQQIMTTEAAQRVETTIAMSVADPETYVNQDQVLLFPEVDGNGDYVPGTGVAYFVDGDSTDERIGPWPALLGVFGGIVRLRRVT